MTRSLAAIAAVLLISLPAFGQSYARRPVQGPLKWRLDVEQAVAEAQHTRRPLMFWVVGRSADRNEKTERDQKAVFRDPAIAQAAQRFIAVQLSRSRYRDLVEKWDLPPRTNLEVVFTTPEGDRFANLAPSGVAQAASFRQKMVLAFNDYRQQLFQKEVLPRLTDESASAADLNTALGLIREFEIRAADDALLRLLKREDLDDRTRKAALGALAASSSGNAVRALFDAALAGDADALSALESCTPVGAEHIVDKIGREDEAAHLLAYNACARICNIRNPKPERFWDGPNERVKQEEIENIKRQVERAARDWRRRYEDG